MNSSSISEILDLEENQYIKLSVYSDVHCAHHTSLNITGAETLWILPSEEYSSNYACVCHWQSVPHSLRDGPHEYQC